MANQKPPKPRHHGRDHLPGGEDPIPGLTLGGVDLPWAVAIRYEQTFLDNTDTTVTLTTPSVNADFVTTDDTIFDIDTGRLAILVPGTYLIVAWAVLNNISSIGTDAFTSVTLGSDINCGARQAMGPWWKQIGASVYSARPLLTTVTSWSEAEGGTPTSEPLVVSQRSGHDITSTGIAGIAIFQTSPTGQF